MKRDIAEFRTSSFIDFEGKERKFVVCALSQSPEEYDDYEMQVGWVDLNDKMDCGVPVKRIVSIGVSLCNPVDEFNEKIGQKIAQNKAEDDDHCLSQIYTPSNGAINTKLVDAYLEQEIDFIKEHPEKIFKGYYSAKLRYEKQKEHEALLNSVDNNHKSVYNMIKDEVVDLGVIKSLLK